MRILLVEDGRDLAAWLTKALAQSGFVVDWVDDGRMAAAALKETHYDAMVLAQLRRQDHRLPVLILTACSCCSV